MQMAGFGNFFLPMAGSIRAFITGNWINGSFSGTKSDNIKELTRLATGRFFLNFGSDGTAMLLSYCTPIGYYTRTETVATDYSGTWAMQWGMIIGVPFGGAQIGGDYGLSLTFKDNNSDNLDEDPVRFALIIVG
jgi:hypothetical protein